MKFKILSPTEKRTVNVLWIEANTNQGNFVIQPEHAPIILILKQDSSLLFKEVNKKENEEISIPNGLLEIQKQQAMLLISPL